MVVVLLIISDVALNLAEVNIFSAAFDALAVMQMEGVLVEVAVVTIYGEGCIDDHV